MEEIVRIIRVDTKNSDKSIKDLKNEINGLKKELEQTTVGSEEFNSALKRLTQTQKSYNEIQQQVRDMSKTGQQDMVNFAKFASNLGKSYSALNAAIGLFANGNEDVQKSMLKVQRTIQLVQGLDGITGLIRDLPKVAAGFRSWLNSLSPIDRTVDRIAKGINGISPQKLKAINDANRGGGSAAAAAAGGGGGNINVNTQQLQEQQKVMVPLNAEFDKYNKELISAKATLKEWRPEISRLSDIFEEYNLHTTEAKINMEEYGKSVSALMNGDPSKLHNFLKNSTLDIDALDKTAKKFGVTSKQLTDGLKNIEEGLGDDSNVIKSIENDLNGVTKATEQSTSAFKKLGGTLKSIFSTVGWTLLITALVTAAYKLVEWTGELIKARTEQQKLNKAISEGTNQIASKQIVVLKELALGYQRLGDSVEDKRKFLEKYKDKIRDTGISVNDLKKAEDVFVNNTEKYVNAIMARAKAQATENQAIKIYQEYLDERYALEQEYETNKNKRAGTQSKESYINLLIASGSTPEQAEQAWATATNNRQEKILSDIEKIDRVIEDRLRKMFKDIADLELDYYGLLGGGSPTEIKQIEDTIKKDLDTLLQYLKEAEQMISDEESFELQSVMDKYVERIALAKKYGKDYSILEMAMEEELARIRKKYADKRLDDEKKDIENAIRELEAQITNAQLYERLRNAKLSEPRPEDYQTDWYFLGAYAATSQTFSQIKAQRDAEIEYNNKYLESLRIRIEEENQLLKQELEIIGLTENEKLEIRTRIAENEKALSDAVRDTEIKNNEAKINAQLKYQAAVQASVEVAGSLTGAIANMYKLQAQDESKSAEERKKAAKTYKKLAKAQAIIDTFAAANAAFRAMAEIPPAPAWGIAAAAAAVIAGMANVRAIEQESVVSSMSSTVSGSSVSAPSALNTPPIDYTRNLIGDKELDSLNQPIKCYVLESDIRNVSNKVTVTEQNASF